MTKRAGARSASWAPTCSCSPSRRVGTPRDYDALDVGQWEFYVLPVEVLEAHGGRSVGLPFLHEHADGTVSYSGLRSAVEAAAGGR